MKNNKKVKLYFILFCISLTAFFIIIPLLLFLLSNGYLEEGIIGFIKFTLIRIICLIIVILLIIRFFQKTKKAKYLKIIAIIIICLITFFLLKAPILDIKYLFNPQKITLNNISFEIDDVFENSTFYEINGENKEKQYTFRLNKASLQNGKKAQNKNIKTIIYYLPNTKVVIKIYYVV